MTGMGSGWRMLSDASPVHAFLLIYDKLSADWGNTPILRPAGKISDKSEIYDKSDCAPWTF